MLSSRNTRVKRAPAFVRVLGFSRSASSYSELRRGSSTASMFWRPFNASVLRSMVGCPALAGVFPEAAEAGLAPWLPAEVSRPEPDRTSVGYGKSVSVHVDLGGAGVNKKKKKK